MNLLPWFRVEASLRELKTTLILLLGIPLCFVLIANAEDWDGDGYDDDTGELVGDLDSDSDGLTDDEEFIGFEIFIEEEISYDVSYDDGNRSWWARRGENGWPKCLD